MGFKIISKWPRGFSGFEILKSQGIESQAQIKINLGYQNLNIIIPNIIYFAEKKVA
jgi:hypothetical protein